MPEGEAIEISERNPADTENHLKFEIAEAQILEQTNVERFLANCQERYADSNNPQDPQMIIDLIDYLGSKADDVLDKRKQNSAWKKDMKNISNMKNMVAGSIVEGFDETDENVILLRQLLKEEKNNASEANKAFFTKFLEFLPQPATEVAVAAPTEETNETAKHTQPQLEDFAYAPVRVNQELLKLSKNDFAKAA